MSQNVNERRRWRIVEFDVDREREELAGWLMMQLGANGCEFDSKDDLHTRLRATFETESLSPGSEGRIVAALDEYGLNSVVNSLRYGELVEEDWLAKWKEGFEPFPIGARLLVCPPWRRDALNDADINGRQVVVIDPGLAFGTGFHETTQFCLSALQDYVDGAAQVLDVGAGSGILSIACALLNARCAILALETDQVACKNAAENVALNSVAGRIDIRDSSTDVILNTMAHRFDLILANLTYEDHVALMKDYLRLAAKGSTILFAGILKEKSDQMASLLQASGLTIAKRHDGRAWTGFAARCGG